MPYLPFNALKASQNIYLKLTYLTSALYSSSRHYFAAELPRTFAIDHSSCQNLISN